MIGWWLLWGLVVAVLAWQTRQALREPSQRARITAAAARARVGLPPAAPDNEADVHLADHDECELIWSMPEYDPDLDAGCDRLRQAIREHREEDQT